MRRRVKGIVVLLLILMGVLSAVAVWLQTKPEEKPVLREALFSYECFSAVWWEFFGGWGIGISCLSFEPVSSPQVFSMSTIFLQDNQEIITGHFYSFSIHVDQSNRILFHIRATAPVNFYLVLDDDRAIINATEITSLDCDFYPLIKGLYTFMFEPLPPPRHVATVTFEALLQGPQRLEVLRQSPQLFLNRRT